MSDESEWPNVSHQRAPSEITKLLCFCQCTTSVREWQKDGTCSTCGLPWSVGSYRRQQEETRNVDELAIAWRTAEGKTAAVYELRRSLGHDDALLLVRKIEDAAFSRGVLAGNVQRMRRRIWESAWVAGLAALVGWLYGWLFF